MAYLTKELLPEGTYKVRDENGKRVKQSFPIERLHRIADTGNEMVEAGLKIPIPFDHKKEARPRTEEEEKVFINKASPSYKNGGYWEKLFVANNNKGKPSLYGIANVEGETDDKESNAYRLKNNKEVSVSVADKFEDGLGRTWTDGLLHAASVNHAVVPDQEDWEEGVTIVSMSSMVESEENEPTIDEVRLGLRKVGVYLPGDTTKDTFLRDVLVATLNTDSQDSDRYEPVPIYMSTGELDMQFTIEQATALVDGKVENPATKKPYTMEELGFKKKEKTESANVDLSALETKLKEKDQQNAALIGALSAFKTKVIKDTQALIEKRISSLVDSHPGVTKEFAEATLRPKVSYEMSIVGGEIQDHPLEATLSALEATMPKSKGDEFPDGGVLQNIPTDTAGDANLTDEQMNNALDSMAKDGLL